MPRTKLRNIEDKDRQINAYYENLAKIRMQEAKEWDTGFTGKSKYKEARKQATLDLIGATLTEDEFAALEENVEKIESVRVLFEKMSTELTALQIKMIAQSSLPALIGNKQGLNDDQWQNEFNEVYKNVELLSEKNEKKVLQEKENAVKNYAKKQADSYKIVIRDRVQALADGKYDEKTGKDPLDAKQKEAMVGYAAMLVSVQTEVIEKKNPKAKDLGYDYDQVSEWFAQKKKNQKVLEKDLKESKEFAAFVAEQRAKGLTAADFKPENLVKSYDAYKEKLMQARNNYSDFMRVAKDKIKDDNNELMQYPNLMFNNGHFIDDEIPFTKETIQDRCKFILSDKTTNGTHLSMDKFVNAANLIIADTLLSPAADKTFFNDISILKKGKPDMDLVNKAFVEMRDQVINDPIFREVLATRPTSGEFVDKYKKAVNKEINKKINAEKSEKARRKGDRALDESWKQFGDNNTATISKEEYEKIVDARKKLDQFNDGKKPSDHMKRLTEALDQVISQGKGNADKKGYNIDISALTELNSASLNYYNKRQGILFSPLTDNGKARYATVEKLTFVTDKIQTRCKEAFENKNNANIQPKKMGK